MGVNKEAGRRSEAPFSRREEGRELGEEKREREKEKEGNEKKKEKLCQILTEEPLRKILETWRY